MSKGELGREILLKRDKKKIRFFEREGKGTTNKGFSISQGGDSFSDAWETSIPKSNNRNWKKEEGVIHAGKSTRRKWRRSGDRSRKGGGERNRALV